MRWRVAVVGVGLTVGCSTFGASDSDSPNMPPAQSNVGLDGGPLRDAAEAAVPTTSACDPTKAFDAPQPFAELNTSGDAASARLSADELEVVFEVNTGLTATRADLFMATRASIREPFGAPRTVAEVNTVFDDAHPYLSDDGLELVFASARRGTWDLYRAGRSSRATVFGAPELMTVVSDAQTDEYSPFIVPVTNELWFSRASRVDSIFRLFVAPARGLGDKATQAITVTESDTSEEFPVLSADAKTLYVAKTISVALTKARTSRIHVATRTSVESAFGSFTELTEVNKTASQLPTYLSTDGCRLYLCSVIGLTEDKFEIRVAERSR